MLSKSAVKNLFSSAKSKPVYIVAGKRTAIGSFLGKLSNVKGTELASTAIKGCID
jgi:hypothetical protein